MVISVILTVHDQLPVTQNCLQVLRMLLQGCAYEILVVDNGSGKETQAWLAGQDVTVIRNEENLSLPKTWNQGVAQAQGDVLLFLHNDILLAPQALGAMLGVLETQPHAGAVGPCTNRVTGFGSFQGVNVPPYTDYAGVQEMARLVEEQLTTEVMPFLAGFCVLMKKSVYDVVGSFDERFTMPGCEMLDYSMRMQQKGWYLYRVNTYVHHGEDTPRPQGLDRKTALAQQEQILYEKWNVNVRYSANVRKDVLQFMDLSKKDLTVLDVGCAMGGNLGYIRQHNPQADLYGIELNEAASSVAACYGHVTAMDVEQLHAPEWNEKWLNAKPCGILDFAHTTHGLNP